MGHGCDRQCRNTEVLRLATPASKERSPGTPVRLRMTASEWGALALLERFVVEDEAVLDVVAEDAVVGFVELVVGGELDVGDDTLVGAEVEHLLGFFHAADGGAGE